MNKWIWWIKTALILLFCCTLNLQAQWTQSLKQNGTAYFLLTNNFRLERYSLSNEQWLSPISLPTNYGPPTSFWVDQDGVFVAYNQSVKRYSWNGFVETHVISTPDPIVSLFTDGNLLLINRSSYSYARYTSVNKNNNAVIATFENYIYATGGAAIAPSVNKVFGRSLGVSPSDITYVSYNDDGSFAGGGDSRYHGDYPYASKTWVFPGETKVVDNSGTVYSTADLTYLRSFGGSLDDLDFYGVDVPIVLRGTNLVAYNSAILPSGSRGLDFTPGKIYVASTNVITFTTDLTQTNSIRADKFPLSSLNPATPGQPINPQGLSFTPDFTFVDKDGFLLLVSKNYQSIFKWSPVKQMYYGTIPLANTPSYAAYSAHSGKMYLAYSSGLITEINLAQSNPTENPFTILATAPCGLAVAGSYIFAMDNSGAWGTHYTFNESGQQISSKDWNYYSREFIWSDINQKMYFFRDDTSPNDLLSEEISATGVIGIEKDSPLHDSTGFTHPIRVSPDGTLVVLGSGCIHNANTLERLSTGLPNSVSDIAWMGNKINTVRTISNLAQLQSWSSSNYALGTVRQLPGQALALLNVKTNLLAITMDGDQPNYYLLDQNFQIMPPAALTVPTNFIAQVTSSQVTLSWSDICGEEDYIINRQVGSGAWVQIATPSTSSTNYVDTTVSVGNTYTYQLIARNKGLVSAPALLTVNLTIPATPSAFSVWHTTAYEIFLHWSDVTNESRYLLERSTNSNGAFVQIAILDANSTWFTNRLLTPDTEYFYRLRATNGVGSSAYSPVIRGLTAGLPASIPDFQTLTAIDSSSVLLTWKDSTNEYGYVVERRTAGVGTWETLTTLAANITNYTDYTVSPVSAYDYRLYSTNRLGSSGYSTIRTILTPQLEAPIAPAYITTLISSNCSVHVMWANVSKESGYRLQRRTENTNSWTIIATLSANTCTFLDSNVVEHTEYFYRVQAFNNSGNSPWSPESSVIPVRIIHLFDEPFDPTINSRLWTSVTGIVTNGAGFNKGNALWFGDSSARSATTVPIDVATGGKIGFSIRAGNESVDGSTFWNNSESAENVVLEYSTNGVNWLQIQLISSVYPALTNWTSFSVDIPLAGRGTQTQFRWRQLSHSGAGYDQWAIDDVFVEGVAPVVPTPPPFLITSPSSSTSIAIFWIDSPLASFYIVERKQGIGAWTQITTVPSTQTYFTDRNALPSTGYMYRIVAGNASGLSQPSLPSICVTWSQMQDWVCRNYGDPNALSASEMTKVDESGISALYRYAFNMDATENPCKMVPGNTTKGLAAIWLDKQKQSLSVEFVRRRADTRPGITYLPQFSSDLKNWTTQPAPATITPIDSTWERVKYEEPIQPTAQSRFSRVIVVQE